MSIIKGYIIGNILFGIRGFPIFSKKDIQLASHSFFEGFGRQCPARHTTDDVKRPNQASHNMKYTKIFFGVAICT